MPTCEFSDFNIRIDGDTSPYALHVGYGGRTAIGSFAPSLLLPTWRAAHEELLQTIQNVDTPDLQGIERIGARLWAALMHGEVRDLWIAARTDQEQGRVQGLRLRLDLPPLEVAALPWECLYDPDRGTVFAIAPNYTLVRVATLFRHLGTFRDTNVTLPVRVLIAAPDDPFQTIDIPAELAAIREALSHLDPAYVNVVEYTEPFSITALRNKLREVKPTILHFIGHGEPAGLWMWQRNKGVIVPAQSLHAVLQRSPSVKLAVLNACLAARPTGPNGFSGVAAHMLQAGLLAVVAMQYPIRNDAAVDFAQAFYEELICGSSPGFVDLAISAARDHLYTVYPGNFSYGTPVLWLNNPDGRIFVPQSAADTPAEDSPVAAPPPSPILPPPLDVDAEQAWLEAIVTDTDLDRLPAAFGFLRSRWDNLVKELRSLLAQLESLSPIHDAVGYADKLAVYKRYKAALLRVQRLIHDASTPP